MRALWNAQTMAGMTWEDAVKKKLVYNAAQAAKKLGLDGNGLEAQWAKIDKKVDLVKFGGGFYCTSHPNPLPGLGWACELGYGFGGKSVDFGFKTNATPHQFSATLLQPKLSSLSPHPTHTRSITPSLR